MNQNENCETITRESGNQSEEFAAVTCGNDDRPVDFRRNAWRSLACGLESTQDTLSRIIVEEKLQKKTTKDTLSRIIGEEKTQKRHFFMPTLQKSNPSLCFTDPCPKGKLEQRIRCNPSCMNTSV